MPVIKPILNKETHDAIFSTLSRYRDKVTWTKWGMNQLGEQGAAILLYGPPGTGKDTTVHYIAHEMGKTIVSLNMGEIGGSDPGHCERKIVASFKKALKENMAVVFINECESLLWDRDRAGEDSMWMLGVIGQILQSIEAYPGLTIMATNKHLMLDTALERRLLAKIHVGKPAYAERVALWKQKIPSKFPLQLSNLQLEKISNYELTGAQIITAIRREAEYSIMEKKIPSYSSLLRIVQSLSTPANGNGKTSVGARQDT